MPARPVTIRSRFGWEILAALLLKAVGLWALYSLFFAPALRPVVTDQGTAWHLVSPPPALAAPASDGDVR